MASTSLKHIINGSTEPISKKRTRMKIQTLMKHLTKKAYWVQRLLGQL